MRRFSAFLMIAALVAVLVPSAALAAKPVPSITNIDVVSVYPVNGVCTVEVIVSFTGRPYDAYIQPVRDESGVGADAPLADNKLGRAVTQFATSDLGSADYRWQAVLRDRKGNEISVPRATDLDDFTGSGVCPASGVVVAAFPWR